jgi:hypothetical protein
MTLSVVGIGLAAMLAIAAWLQPSPTGQGTHRQLGLPPCSFQFLFGLPCPSCGMTTSWAHFVRGQWSAALRANVGGTVLAAVAVVVATVTLVSAVSGRALVRVPSDRVLLAIGGAIVLVTLVDWLRRLGILG